MWGSRDPFPHPQRKPFSGIHSSVYRSRVISLHQNECDRLLGFCWPDAANWSIALISTPQHVFIQSRSQALARAPSTSRVSNATNRGGPDCRKAEEARNSRQAAGKRWPGERDEPKFRTRSSNNRGKRDWSLYKEIGWSLCYWPGPCQFCCQFRCQFRCQSRRQFLTRIIASRKRSDNFY